jgi:hypothetical protein
VGKCPADSAFGARPINGLCQPYANFFARFLVEIKSGVQIDAGARRSGAMPDSILAQLKAARIDYPLPW